MNKVGIDDMAVYVPKIFLDIGELAKNRGIEKEKLQRGLGLEKMALPDTYEDAATMGANAVLSLMQKNSLKPQDLGRIYLGTESALDGAKPTSTYILHMLIDFYAPEFGEDCFNQCDVVDMTFACIGGVDALHNTLDWVGSESGKVGIVVTADFAKYDLHSSGEYTQGAGAIALLIKQNPRLISIDETWGIATKPVHDFFKPRRVKSKFKLFKESLELVGIESQKIEEIWNSLDNLSKQKYLGVDEDNIAIFKETPVFDGQYSNDCYKNRINEAYKNFQKKNPKFSLENWDFLAFHLPYAFHGKRIFTEIFIQYLLGTNQMIPFLKENHLPVDVHDYDSPEFVKSIYKSKGYKAFTDEKMRYASKASSEVGNMYACSIFLSLASIIVCSEESGMDLQGKKIGFIAYGSGSKSKVFSGTIGKNWRQVSRNIQLFEQLQKRKGLSYETYEALHREQFNTVVNKPVNCFVRKEIFTEKGVREGMRVYGFEE